MKKSLWFLTGFSCGVAIFNHEAIIFAIVICVITIIIDILVDEE